MWIDSFNNFEKNIEKKSLRELEKEKIKLETQVKKEELKKAFSQSIINKLNSKEGYKVKKNDILSIINEITTKWNHIKFLKPADKIWPWDVIRIIDWKVFRTHNWNDKIVWIVSEGFKTEKIKITTKKKETPKTNIKKVITKNKIGKDKTNTTTVSPKINKKVNATWNKKTKDTFTEIWYIKEGRHYILWKDWKPELITFKGLSPEVKNKLEKLKEQKEEIESAMLLLNAYKIDNPNTKIDNTLKNLSNLITNLLSWKVQTNNFNNELTNILKEVFPDWRNRMWKTENKVVKLFKNNKWEELRISVLNYIRDDLNTYQLTASSILDKNFEQSKIDTNFINKISNELLSSNTWNIKNEVENNKLLITYLKENGISINDFVNKMLDLQQKLIDKKKNLDIPALAKKAWISQEKYEELLNKTMINKWVKVLIFNQFMDSITDNRWKVKNPTNYNNITELNLYSDIEGFGAWNLSDSNTDIAGLILETAVMEIAAFAVGMVTAWAWEVAINTLVAARWAKRWAEVTEDIIKAEKIDKLLNTVKIWNNIYKTTKAWKISYVVWKTVLPWAAFYEWTNAVQNVFENRNIFEWSWNLWEIWKSILFMWAMEWLWKLFQKVPWLKKIYETKDSKLIDKVLKIPAQTVIEWISLWAVWWTINVTLEWWEWTMQDFVEGIIMAAMFKLMWRGVWKWSDFILKKVNWKVEIWTKTEAIKWKKESSIEWTASTSIEFYKDPETWTTYTKTPDWKLINNKNNEIVSITEIEKEIRKIDYMIKVRLNKKQTKGLKKEIKKLREDKIFWEQEKKILNNLKKIPSKKVKKQAKIDNTNAKTINSDWIKTENTSNSSTVEYYQWKTHKYKFENWKWYNLDTWKNLKNRPKNIKEIEEPKDIEWSTEAPINKKAQPITSNWTKTEITKWKKEPSSKENIEKVEDNIHKLFIKDFDEFFPKKLFWKHNTKTLSLENPSWEKIEIKRWTDWQFTIKGESKKLYSRKEILKKIQNDYPEYENNFIKEKAKNKYHEIQNNKEEFVTERWWTMRKNEKITERWLEIKEWWKFRPATQEEINEFLNNNKKIEKLLNESLEQKIKTDIKDNWLKEALLKNKWALIKDIFLWKKYFNLWFPALITIWELHDKKDFNLSMFLKEFSIAYLGSAALNWAFMLSIWWLKLVFSSKPIKAVGEFIKNNWWKMLIIPAWVYWWYQTYIYEKHTK